MNKKRLTEKDSDRLVALHEEFILEFGDIQDAYREERQQCLQDRRFATIAGAQYEGALESQYENKPRFEVNKIKQPRDRITAEYRNNRIDVRFIAKDGKERGELAESCASMYRADVQDSEAEDDARDNAFDEGMVGGFGAWRWVTRYEDEGDPENERQILRMQVINDADTSVFFDLNAKRYNKSDAKRCYLITAMSRRAYKAEYGDDAPVSIDKTVTDARFDWFTPDVVYVCEVYDVETVSEKVYTFTGLLGEVERVRESDSDINKKIEELEATGFKQTGARTIKGRKVHKYIIDGQKVIEDCGYIAGKYIPVIPYYGTRYFIDNVERCAGIVRTAKDVIRLINMLISKLAEISAMSSVEKPIFTPEQIAGHQASWEDDNIKNYPYLLINRVDGIDGNPAAIGPQAYTKSPQIPPALAALIQIVNEYAAELLGKPEAAQEVMSNISGKAVQLIQQRLDMQSYIYISNFAKSVRWSGVVWLSMKKDVSVFENDKVKGVSYDGSLTRIELNRPVIDEESGEMYYDNDVSKAELEVAVEIGPSAESKRSSAVSGLSSIAPMATDPNDSAVLLATILMNLDAEGIQDARSYFRNKLLKIGAVKPTEEEREEMEKQEKNAPPDPQTALIMANVKQLENMAEKAQADTSLSQARARNTEAKTMETLIKMDAQAGGVEQQIIGQKEQLNNQQSASINQE